MKAESVLLPSIAMVLVGCFSIQEVSFKEKEQWIPEAQKALLSQEADVTMMDGRSYEGKIVSLDPDSLWLQGESSNSPFAVPLDHINLITPSRNVGAPLGGFLGGAVVGGLIGGVIGSSQKTDGQLLSRLGNTMYSGAVGAGVGAALGGLSLGLATSVTDYRIVH